MSKNAKQRMAQAVFESLEGRSYMSASVTLTGGVLSLQADPNTASVLQVQPSSKSGYLSAHNNNILLDFPTSQVKKIVIVGSNKNDQIYITPSITVPANIQGNAGNDTIKAGLGNDTIDGGDGNDIIYGHGIIYTGAGADTVWGSNLGDQIFGGSGNDLLVGGSGNDTIVAGTGNTTIIGGLGNDHLYAGNAWTANIQAGSKSATIVGGSGWDTLRGAGGGNVLFSGASHNQLLPGRGDIISRGALPTTPSNPLKVGTSPTPPTTPIGTQSNPPKTGGSSNPPPVQTPPVQTPPVQTPPIQNPPPTTTGTGSSTLTAAITQLESTIIAGEGVEVNALASNLHGANPVTVKYAWDFGDPNSQFNTLPGWTAGHVYDTPGVYTITLKMTDINGGVSTATTRVTVNADTRPIIYVNSATGSDSNDGSSPAQAVKTAAQAFSMLSDNTRILFARGLSYSVTAQLHIDGHDIAVGAYGSGASPTFIRSGGDYDQTIFISTTSSNVTIQGLTFDSIYPAVNGIAPKIPASGIWAEGTNVVVRDNTFLNLTDAVNGSGQPNGVIVLDNSAPLSTGIRAYFCWVNGTNWNILGNYAANSTREHIVRGNNPSITAVLVDGNNFTNSTNPLDPAEVVKCTVNFRGSNYVYVADNTLNQGTLAFDSPGAQFIGAMNKYVVIQDNTLNSAQLQLWGNVDNAVVRNNVFNDTGMPDVLLQVSNTVDPTVRLGHVTVTGNTGINTGATGSFLTLYGDATPNTISVTHNLFSAPNLLVGASGNAGMYVVGANLNAFSLISNNIWPAPSGVNKMYPDTVNAVTGSIFPYGYMTADQWNATAQVVNDVFQDIALAKNTYKATLNGVTAGVQATAA